MNETNPLHDIIEKKELENTVKCCKNNCRHRNHINPPKEISHIDDTDLIKPEKKKKNRPPRKNKPPTFEKAINGSAPISENKDEVHSELYIIKDQKLNF